MIIPTVGRKVWYWPRDTDGMVNIDEDPHDATIVGVLSNTCVNLACHDAEGRHYVVRSVLLWQDTEGLHLELRPSEGFAEWMPYQTGQAAKAAALDAEPVTPLSA